MHLACLGNFVSSTVQPAAAWLFETGGPLGFDPWKIWIGMQWPARTIVLILLIMSAWSLGVMFDRWIAFSAARKQSRQLAPFVAGALRQGNLDEAIRLTERNKK